MEHWADEDEHMLVFVPPRKRNKLLSWLKKYWLLCLLVGLSVSAACILFYIYIWPMLKNILLFFLIVSFLQSTDKAPSGDDS